MAIRAQLADGRILEFPDGTPDAVIDRTVQGLMGESSRLSSPANDEYVAGNSVGPEFADAFTEITPRRQSVLQDAPLAKGPGLIEQRGAPVRPEVMDAARRAYDSASPEERQRLAALPGYRGGVVRAIDERARQTDAAVARAPTASILDTRQEARQKRLMDQGMEVESAAIEARERARLGIRSDQIDKIGATDFDFDAQSEYARPESKVVFDDKGFARRVGPTGIEELGGAIRAIGGKLGASVDQVQGGARQMAGDFLSGIGADDFGSRVSSAGSQQQRSGERRAEAIGENRNGALNFLEVGVTGAIQNLAPFLLGPQVGLASMGAQVAFQEYGQGRSAGLSPEDALARAAAMTVAELVGERASLPTPLIKAFKDTVVGKKAEEILPEFGRFLVKENVAEQATTAMQFGVDKFAPFGLRQDATFTDYLQAVGDTLYQTTAQTLVAGGAAKGLGSAVNAYRNRPLSPEQEIAREIDRGVAGTEFVDADPLVRNLLRGSGADPSAVQTQLAVERQRMEQMRRTAPADIMQSGSVDEAIDTALQSTQPLPDAPQTPANPVQTPANPRATPFAGVQTPMAGVAAGLGSSGDQVLGNVLGALGNLPTAAAVPAVDAAPEIETGRRGDGYATMQDARQALAFRLENRPELDWSIEPDGERFVLVGRAKGASDVGTPSAPVAGVSGIGASRSTDLGSGLALDGRGAAAGLSGGGDANGVRAPDGSTVVGADGATPAGNAGAVEPIVLQNRDRSSAASVSQMNSIAANPDYLRAGPSREMVTGAPVVFGDTPASAVVGRQETVTDGRGQRIGVQYAVVEATDLIASNRADGTPVPEYQSGAAGKMRAVAGNGRTAGLQEAYNRGTTRNYQAELLADLPNVGIDAAAVQGMKRPVLVRVMSQSDVTADIGDRTNTAVTQNLSAVEQAANDTRRIDVSALEFTDAGDPTPAAIRSFVFSLPESEQGNLLNRDGTPTRQAVDRIMAATFKAAYGDDGLVQLYAQATDPDARSVINAAAMSAGSMARLADAAPEFDIRGVVSQAIGIAVNASRQGVKVGDFAANRDMTVDDAAADIARFIGENIRSPKKMAEGLRRMAELAAQQQAILEDNASNMGMFGEQPTANRQEIISVLFQVPGQSQVASADPRVAQDGGQGSQRGAADPAGAGGVPSQSIGGSQAAADGAGQAQGLTAPTREDVLAQQDRAANAGALDQRDQIRRESEAGAGLFSLEMQDGRVDDTGDLFGASSPQASTRDASNDQDGDYLDALFGAGSSRGASASSVSAPDPNPRGLRDSVAAAISETEADINDWETRQYKGNRARVELRGDGPSNQESLSIGSINEGRRTKVLTSLREQRAGLQSLSARIGTEAGAKSAMAEFVELYDQTAADVARGTFTVSKDVDAEFEYRLLSRMGGSASAGRGSVASNKLSKTVLAAVKAAKANRSSDERLTPVSKRTKNQDPTYSAGDTFAVKDGGQTFNVRVLDNSAIGKAGPVLQVLAQIFGKRIVVIDPNGLNTDGFVRDGDNTNIFIDRNSGINPVAVFFHELTHLIAREMPEVFAALQAVVERNLKTDALDRFQDDYGGPARNYKEELISDLVGNRIWRDPGLLGEVLAEVAAQNPDTARAAILKFAAYVTRAVDAAVRALRQQGFTKTDPLVKNLQEVKDAVKTALVEYAKEQGISAAQVEVAMIREGTKADLTAASRVTKTTPRGSPADFIPAPNGSPNYGLITPEMSQIMRREAGPIRLNRGVQNEDGSGYGLAHIEARHGDQIRSAGYTSVQEFLLETFSEMGSIWSPPGNSQLIAVQSGRTGKVAFIQLEIDSSAGRPYYRINSAFPASESYVLRKERKAGWKPLWSRYPVPADASGASGFVDQSPKAGETAPTVSPQSGAESVPNAAADGNGPDGRVEKSPKRSQEDRQSDRAQRISPRLPTAVKATENPMGEVRLQPDLATAMRDERSFAHNINLIASYPNFSGLTGAPAQMAETMISHMQSNLVWLFQNWKPEFAQRSRLWYVGGNRIATRWADRFGVPSWKVAAVIAATSPQKDWFQNVSLAERILEAVVNNSTAPWTDEMSATVNSRDWGGSASRDLGFTPRNELNRLRGKTLRDLFDPDNEASLLDMAVWVRAWDETYNPMMARVISPEGAFIDEFDSAKSGKPIGLRWQSFATIAKTLQILQAQNRDDVSQIIGANHKVRSFFNNIIAPFAGEDVTIDTHAVAAALLRPLGSSATEVAHNFGTNEKGQPGPKNSSITGLYGTYAIYAEAYRRAAKQVGVLPREMQSVTWEAVRGLFRPEQKNAKIKAEADAIWTSFAQGGINAATARQQILELVQGIQDPAWVRSPAGANEAARDSSYEAGVSGNRVPGRGAQSAAAGSRDGSARDVPTDVQDLSGVTQSRKRNLVVLHNPTEANVRYAASLGGLPVPSLGITKVDSPFTDFGDISLIAPAAMVDPKTGVPVFDRDAWTSRFPEMNFKKPRAAKIREAQERVRAIAEAVGVDGDMFRNQFTADVDNARSPTPSSALRPFERYYAPRLFYVRNVLGRNMRVPMRPERLNFEFSTSPGIVAFVKGDAGKAYKKAYNEMGGMEFWGSEQHRKATDVFKAGIEEWIDSQSEEDEVKQILKDGYFKSSLFDQETGLIYPNRIDRVWTDVSNIGKKTTDETKLREALDRVVKVDDPGYQAWAKSQIDDLFDEPTITLRGREVAPTLQNIVDAMTIGATAGVEKSMTFSAGKTAANLGKRFKSLDEIRAERDRVVPQAVEKEQQDKTNVILEAYRTKALEFYTERDWKGQVDTWNGLDAAMKSLADAGKLADTDGNIRLSLQRNKFRGIDAQTIDLARQSIKALREAATDYFEAKPQRAVGLSEFRGAVIPKSTSDDVRQILADAGLEVVEYNKARDGARDSAIDKLSKKLDKVEQDILLTRKRAYNSPDGYTTDLFGNPLPGAQGGTAGAEQSAPASSRDMDAAAELRADPPEGNYATRTQLVTTRQQKLGAKVILTLEDSANALAYLNRSAVERFDAIVTDKAGRPLAVVGGFKGERTQTSVYPATVLSEAILVPGAANLWLVHNHPSDRSDLSSADRNLAQMLRNVFDGTGIEVRGMVAVAGDSWSGAPDSGFFQRDETGRLSPVDGPTVPAQERELIERGKLGPALGGPSDAKRVVLDLVAANQGRPTIVLLDAGYSPLAAVPWAAGDAMPLKGNGKLDALYRAVAASNAYAAIIGLGDKNPMSDAQAMNIGAALKKVDTQVLDIVPQSGPSFAERGKETAAKVLMSRKRVLTPEIRAHDERIVTRINAAIRASGASVTMADTYANLPQEAQDAASKAGLLPDEFMGVTIGRGRVYVVQDNHSDSVAFESTVLHEVYGHVGLRTLFGNDLYSRLNRMYLSLGDAKVRELADKYGVSSAGYFEMAAGLRPSTAASRFAGGADSVKRGWIMEELLARIAEKETGTLKQRALELIGAIRGWLRDKGFDGLANLNMADIARVLKMGRTTATQADDDRDLPLAFSRKRQTDTPEFKRWSGGSPVVQLGEAHEFRSGQPVVVEALHGSTNSGITTFDRDKASFESDFGAGFYSSNTPEDVAVNYANVEGPDLTRRIERLAEQIERDDEFEGDSKEAVRLARQRLSEESPNTMKLYVRFSNPAVLGGKGETYFDYNEEFNEDKDEYGEPTGLLVDFVNALDEIGSGLDVSMRDVENAKAKLFEAAQGDGIKFSDLSRIVKEEMADTFSEDGNSSGSSEALRQALEGMGFDGVIDTTVSKKFGPKPDRYGRKSGGMAGMSDYTIHFIAFAPTQLKSATGNNGDFDPANPDIAASRKRTPLNYIAERDELGKVRFGFGSALYRQSADIANVVLDKLAMKPISPELSKAMTKMKAEIERAKEKTADVAKAMSALSESERQMISDIIEGELQMATVPSRRVLEIASALQQIMSNQTAELKRLGMISDETANRWDGKYLPRFYEQTLGNEMTAWAKAVKELFTRPRSMLGIGGKNLKSRGLWETIPADELDAWIDEGWEVRDPDYDENTSTEVRIWRDYTRQERENMGEIRDAMFRFVMGYNRAQRDISLGKLFEEIASTMASKTEQEGYVQVPKTVLQDTISVNTYGKLAGKWVPKEVLDHLSAFDATQRNGLIRFYQKALSYWKEGKVVLNPVSHANNILSNLTMAHFAGVSYFRPDKYALAMRDLVKNSPMVQEAKDAGLFTGTFNQAELAKQLPEELRVYMQQSESQVARRFDQVWTLLTYFLRKPMAKAYEMEDQYFRFLLYKEARGRGLSPEDAVAFSTDHIFNYDDLPKGARVVRDTALPFFAYTYKVTPVLARTALEYPHRFAMPAFLLYAVNEIFYAMAAGDEEDDWKEIIARYFKDAEFRERVGKLEDEERKNLPPWLQGASASLGTPKAIRLGKDEATNLPVFLDVSKIFPGGDLLDLAANAGGVPFPQPLTPSSPVLGAAAVFLFNKDPFFGKDVVDQNDNAKEAAMKRAEWAWKQFSPAIAVGNYHYDRVMNVIAQTTGEDVLGYTGRGKDGIPVDPAYSAMQTFGIKARPIDLEKSADIREGQERKLIRSIEAEIRQLQRLEERGAITSKRADEQIQRERDKIEAMREKVTNE